MKKRRTIAILVTPGVQFLDVSGPLDVFAEANVQTNAEVYQLRVIGSVPGPIRSSSGVRLVPDTAIGQKLTDKIDTLLVAGAPNVSETVLDPDVSDWLRQVEATAPPYDSASS